MSNSNAFRLLGHINELLNLFLVDEQRFPSAMGKMRYNPVDFQTIRYIKQNSGCRGVEIAIALSVAPTTQQSSLDRLIRKGLVNRDAHPSDLRSKVHTLTANGDALFENILQQDLANMNFILDSLTQAEQASILLMLEKVSQKISKTR